MTHVSVNIAQKRYATRSPSSSIPIIQHLCFILETHEFVCLVGPSGCGKSTLLHIIAGLDTHYEGSVTIGATSTPVRLGYVFQNPCLLPWRTVRENITLILDNKCDKAYADYLLERVGLVPYLDKYPEQLSLGTSRRVALVRAFSVHPDLLLMDEPFTSLDAPTAVHMRELTIQLWQERPHTVLFVTHDIREAITLADRLVFLTASPMKIAYEIPITLMRTARDGDTVERFYKELKEKYPFI